MTSGNSASLRQTIDGHFPVLLRMPTGQEGYSERLNEMHKWLYQRVGLKRFLQSGQPHDGVYFYFDDLGVAQEFVQHFNCELIEITSTLQN